MTPVDRRLGWLLLWFVVGLVVWLIILEAVHAIAGPLLVAVLGLAR